MNANVNSSRISLIEAWAVAGLFALGNFYSPVGLWTGPIVGAWFVGTQKLRRGFLWMVAFGVIPKLIFGWRAIPLTGPQQALTYLGSLLAAIMLGVLPYSFQRLISPRLPGFLSTLPLPLMGLPVFALAYRFHATPGFASGPAAFLSLWFAATIVWFWNRESRATGIIFATGFAVVCGIQFLQHAGVSTLPTDLSSNVQIYLISFAIAILLAVLALFKRTRIKPWSERQQAVAILRSPFTGDPLYVANKEGREALASNSGERFPIRNGIPVFLRPEDLTGYNGKYNHLYETIGGLYDDIQRVFCALKGFDRDAYFRSYMSLLEVKPGDSVLETSVGTGLNYRYLPAGVKLSGLDLSPEMLAHCEVNLRRWQIEADLYLGNAESLPFADSSFDVVFHVGGINFFNDRAKAIREMIRVARPGSLLLIADETEKHVKQVYEKGPGGGLFKNRKAPVAPPVDLVPPKMQEIHLEQMRNGDWYALTFRKPAAQN